jgi:CRP-like cAMP-binding protein
MIARMDAARLKEVPLFSSLSAKEVEKLARWTDQVSIREGEALATEGRFAHEFFVIADGRAEVTQDGERINDLEPGDFFGEIALISDAPRTATVTTTSPVRALVVTARSFQRLVEEMPEIQRNVLAAAVDRLNPKFRREARR